MNPLKEVRLMFSSLLSDSLPLLTSLLLLTSFLAFNVLATFIVYLLLDTLFRIATKINKPKLTNAINTIFKLLDVFPKGCFVPNIIKKEDTMFFVVVFVLLCFFSSPLFFMARDGGLIKAIDDRVVPEAAFYMRLGADPNMALKYAIVTDNIDIVKIAIDKGADVNLIVNKDGDTALMLAARNGYTDIVKFLIDKGANVMARNDFNETALDVAYNDKVRNVIVERSLLKYIPGKNK